MNMMKNKGFAVFILSHGRANNVYTYNSLIKGGYTGKIYILIDNEDKTADEYYKEFGDKVIVFDKKKQAEITDTMDNFEGRKAIVYARNANFKIAKDLGIKYFLQLDDDYNYVEYRFNDQLEYIYKQFGKGLDIALDIAFDIALDYYKSIPVKAIAFAQGGDFIGGKNNHTMAGQIHLKRKCMNTWFLDSDNPIEFKGKMNEDYTASVYYGSIGDLFFTIPQISIKQINTQKATGGMSDIYADNGTYIKTFYSIMIMPSCVKVSMMGDKHRRIHHFTNWNNAVPVILDEKYKK
jgi:hypothetical protein